VKHRSMYYFTVTILPAIKQAKPLRWYLAMYLIKITDRLLKGFAKIEHPEIEEQDEVTG
jgi:hypothetical protein